MSTIQMHYDGWFTLPEAARQRFHLTTGDRLEVELAGDTIVLRPTRGTAAPGRAATAEPTPAAPEEPAVTAEPAAAAAAPAPAPVPEPVAKRGPGRPRKVPAAAALPPRPKTRGRRKAASTVEAQAH